MDREYGFQQLLFLRAGYDCSPTLADDKETIFGAALGAGFHTLVGEMVVRLTYAYPSVEYFGIYHMFLVVLGLLAGFTRSTPLTCRPDRC